MKLIFFFTGVIRAVENKATSWVITKNGLDFAYNDSVTRTDKRDLRIRAVIWSDYEKGKLKLIKSDGINLTFNISENFNVTDLENMYSGVYDIYWNEKLVKESVKLKRGGVYTITGYLTEKVKELNILKVTQENSIHMLWLIPQYVVMTMGEVLFSVTGLEFAFTQAPISMKSLLQAAWLLTVAFGNLVVIIIAETSLMKQVKKNYFYFLFVSWKMEIKFFFFFFSRMNFYYLPL